MAFSPAPRTWADSDFVTGTMMDTEIRDNLNQLLIPTVTAYTATDYSTVATAATVTAGGAVPAIPAMYVMVGDGASHTFAVTIASTAGAVRVSAGVTMGCN